MLASCNENTGEAQAQTQSAPPPPEVTVQEVSAGPVPLTYTYAARVSAFREIEVRARVGGILLKRDYIEGERVREGQELFRIDPATYQAEVARVQAQLQQAQAQLANSRINAERAAKLFASRAGSERDRDDTAAQVRTDEAAVAAAQAQLKTAQLNLDYTTVTAPLGGMTSIEEVPEGSLISTNGLLTRITQLDPAYVSFSFSDADFAEIRRLLDEGKAEGPQDRRFPVTVKLGDGRTYDQGGTINFTDSIVDNQTGTIRARAVLPNAQGLLMPNQFVRVTVSGLTLKQGVVVPQMAVMQGPQGPFAYALGEGNKAEARPLTLGREVEGGWLVESGLKGGDRIITEGVIKVRPGSLVRPSEARVAEATP
ncbi:hemolysin D [Inquilinus limosus MP06]|uniref:Hemolysin D n=1 Tax=Inquilinus limosus MP06 TaxID=1398085 RepID=A0A0A0DBU4_9PROT|nr:hemolysin D [Inquilinus limosus MP06]